VSKKTQYRSLHSALEGWYDRPLAEYPQDLRTWIESGLGLGMKPERAQTWWDEKSLASRLAYAKQWDFQHDPATKEQREKIENFFNAHDHLELKISEWEKVDTPTALDLAKRDEMLETLRPQFEAMKLTRREMRGDFPAVAVVAEVKDQTAATRSAEPALIDRNEVIAKFRVKPDEDKNRKFWDGKLGLPPKWLLPALGQRGKRGTSSLWKPLEIGHCLLAGVHNRPFLSLRQLDAMIHKGFPEWLETWEEQTEYLR